MALPTRRAHLSSSVNSFWKDSHRHTQKHVSIMILNPVKLTVKTNHCSLCQFSLIHPPFRMFANVQGICNVHPQTTQPQTRHLCPLSVKVKVKAHRLCFIYVLRGSSSVIGWFTANLDRAVSWLTFWRILGLARRPLSWFLDCPHCPLLVLRRHCQPLAWFCQLEMNLLNLLCPIRCASIKYLILDCERDILLRQK